MCDDLPNGSSLFLHTYSMDRHSALLIALKKSRNLSYIENSKDVLKSTKASAKVLATLISQSDGMPKSESNDRTEIQHFLTLNREEGKISFGYKIECR